MGLEMKLKLSLLAAMMAAALTGCGGSSGGSSSDDNGSAGGSDTSNACTELSSDTFTCDQMLNDIVEYAIRPSTAALSAASQELHDTTDTYCAALGEENEAATLISAKAAWSTAMIEVQQLNAMEIGPLANSDTGLTAIYAWPIVSSCLVDIQVMAGELGPNNRAGLFAMEYLLFGPAGETSCTGTSDVVDWAATKTTDEIQLARCDYAKLVTGDLINKTSALATAMDEYDLASANNNDQVSAGFVSDALFYNDKQTKDVKIKGLLPQADTEAFDASAAESQFARTSKEHIYYNLQGARKLFTANSNVGLDDYLVASGQQSIADDMLATLDATIDNLDALSSNTDATNDTLFDIVSAGENVQTCLNLGASGIYDNASSDIDTFCALQYSIKQFTDILKGDYTLLTSFTVPASAGGDAD